MFSLYKQLQTTLYYRINFRKTGEVENRGKRFHPSSQTNTCALPANRWQIHETLVGLKFVHAPILEASAAAHGCIRLRYAWQVIGARFPWVPACESVRPACVLCSGSSQGARGDVAPLAVSQQKRMLGVDGAARRRDHLEP